MRTMRTLLAAALAALAISGCVSVQSARLGAGIIRPPVPADNVAIYRTPEQVGARYEEVALLSASGDYSFTNEEKMYKKLREKAGKLGANAIVLDSMTEPTTGAKVANFFIGTPAQRNGKAVAIYIANTKTQ